MTVQLRHEQQTMLWTLAMHARDAATAQPILGDRFASDILDRVDGPSLDGLSIGGNTPLICTRAKLIDDAARAFLDRHAEAVVLHLGCGLDSRVRRLDPGPGVQWFDVDQEPVIALRRQFYDDRENVTTIAASVTDRGWASRLPDDRPRLVIAEGLLMYLDLEGVRTAVRSSTTDLDAAAPSGTLTDRLSLVDATATRTGGVLSTGIRLFALVPGARDAMVLSTYEQ